MYIYIYIHMYMCRVSDVCSELGGPSSLTFVRRLVGGCFDLWLGDLIPWLWRVPFWRAPEPQYSQLPPRWESGDGWFGGFGVVFHAKPLQEPGVHIRNQQAKPPTKGYLIFSCHSC